MDLISHTLTGIAAGTVISSISKKKWSNKVAIIFFGGLGGAIPDLDAISLWSNFDVSIGELLKLSHSGSEIYFGKYWYSHHGAFHSIVSPIILSFLVFFMFYFFDKNKP